MNKNMDKSIIYNNNIKKTEKMRYKVYQEWKGNNKFCFKGKIYVGSEYYYGLLTFLYLIINYLIYVILVVKVSIIYFFI